jgi:hypothetical protein
VETFTINYLLNSKCRAMKSQDQSIRPLAEMKHKLAWSIPVSPPAGQRLSGRIEHGVANELNFG